MWEHESYNSREFSNDVSLLRLDEPLEFNEYVQPLKLAELGKENLQLEYRLYMF